MKKYRVQGYIPAGVHRWKLVDKVVEVCSTNPTEDSAIGAWLMKLDLEGRIMGSPYEIKSVEEVTE